MLLALASLLSSVPAGDSRTALDAAGGLARDWVSEAHRGVLRRASKLHNQRVIFAKLIASGGRPFEGSEDAPAEQLAAMDREVADLSAAEEWVAAVEHELYRLFPRRPPTTPAGPP
jgi:hypothetical protein